MEQLVARRAHNPKVAGSSPAPATKLDDSSTFDDRPFLFPSIPDNRESSPASLDGVVFLFWRTFVKAGL